MSSDPNTKSSPAERTVIAFVIFVCAVGIAAAGGVLLDVWLHG
ncbi:MAG: hypothetical protein ACU0BB_17335 [Paracoccaceae bacterium]